MNQNLQGYSLVSGAVRRDYDVFLSVFYIQNVRLRLANVKKIPLSILNKILCCITGIQVVTFDRAMYPSIEYCAAANLHTSCGFTSRAAVFMAETG